MAKLTVEQLEAGLAEIDEACHALGLPPLSLTVVTDDGKASPVSIRSIEKFGLKHENETMEQAIERIREEMYNATYPEGLA